MSAHGQPGMDLSQVAQAIRELLREFDALGRSIRDINRSQGAGSSFLGGAAAGAAANVGLGTLAQTVGGGPGAVGFSIGSFLTDNLVTNAAVRAARNFGIDTALGTTQDYFRLGNSAEESIRANALRVGQDLPILGAFFGDVQQPLERARSRAAGITTAIARAGGQVDEDMVKSLRDVFLPEEKRAQDAEKLTQKVFGEKETIDKALEGHEGVAGFVNAVGEFGKIVDRLAAALSTSGTGALR